MGGESRHDGGAGRGSIVVGTDVGTWDNGQEGIGGGGAGVGTEEKCKDLPLLSPIPSVGHGDL